PLLAGAGVIGLAVGFGAQQLVKDVISGFFILAEDQFGVGDDISGAGVSGEVESLSLRLTKIRGSDGVLHHVRNGDLGVVSNSSRGWSVVNVAVPVPKGTDPAAAQRSLSAAITDLRTHGGVEGLLLTDARVVGITEISGDSVSIGITARSTPEGAARVRRAILGAATNALGAASSARAKPAARKRATTASSGRRA
ncbi:MAG: mechanosensitive ion channel family protein, partial [Frankia sp.]|nr:mechanosensitive ion channel family protein [Frankia sp.]